MAADQSCRIHTTRKIKQSHTQLILYNLSPGQPHRPRKNRHHTAAIHWNLPSSEPSQQRPMFVLNVQVPEPPTSPTYANPRLFT
eukprot:363900-Chlamydomonas_euryale.AAC.5